ncbi:helix-turn-helix domain-containing protein [Bacillus swezeyi]|uniref:excisionase family DNA-binding protein n=2 Tax=Bacillus swezeyi TaxID=1925020 RepID=UPI0039C66B8C
MHRRAMPHLRVKSKVIFLEEEIRPTIMHYKKFGWTDPDDEWDVENLRNTKEEPTMIEEAIRKIIRDELEVFVQDIKNATSKENYIGHTNLTAKEAAKYFRTSPSTISNLIHEEGMPHLRMGSRYIIVLEEAEAFLWRETAKRYADTGNIYWTRILERIDYEDKKRKAAFEKAMSNLENSYK